MLYELAEFERNGVWRLVPILDDVPIVRLKWAFKNKMDNECNIVK